MRLNHLPEAARIRKGGNALKDNLRGSTGQGAIGNVGVAGHPANVCCAPEDIVMTNIKAVLHREDGMEQVASSGVLHALWLSSRARGVEDEQRMLCLDPLRLAACGLCLDQVVHVDISPGSH